MRLEKDNPKIRVRNHWGDWGTIIAIEDDVTYILMDNPGTITDGDGETGVEIVLLKDTELGI